LLFSKLVYGSQDFNRHISLDPHVFSRNLYR